MRERGTRLVLCDIAPLGIAAAKKAGIPSVLLENFTWDWIYEGYEGVPGLQKHAHTLAEVFSCTDYRIQTEPVCRPVSGAGQVAPVGRKPRTPAQETRSALGVPEGTPLVLITTGGIPGSVRFLDRIEEASEFCFVLPGASESPKRRGNVILLPSHSEFCHPDLVGAADAVVGKAGYSTLAEVYHAGTRFGFVLSRGFRESGVLGRFVMDHMPAVHLSEEGFDEGQWVDDLPSLLALSRSESPRENGADQAAALLLEMLRA
jgi:hypothetical protein